MMLKASLRESFLYSNDKTRLSKVKHFSSSSLIALSFLETEDNNVRCFWVFLDKSLVFFNLFP